jgi:hypothetical protein
MTLNTIFSYIALAKLGKWENRYKSRVQGYIATATIVILLPSILKLQFTRTYSFNPGSITSDARQIFVPILGDEDYILDPYPSNALIPLQNLLVDMLRIPHRSQKVGGEVNSRFHSLGSSQ